MGISNHNLSLLFLSPHGGVDVVRGSATAIGPSVRPWLWELLNRIASTELEERHDHYVDWTRHREAVGLE